MASPGPGTQTIRSNQPLPASQAARLEQALRERVRGDVRFDAGSRAMYARDASNYRQIPTGVIMPRDPDDVEAVLEVCREFDVPITGRGGGTSLAGQCCNVGVILDFTKHMDHILEIDADSRTALVEPGVVLDHLRDEAKKQGLTFGPDPATHNRCTIGGMIGNNSCGAHAQMSGCMVDNVVALEVLTYDGARFWADSEEDVERILQQQDRQGEIYRTLKGLVERHEGSIRSLPDIPRRVSGYSLDQLLPESGFNVARALVGTESTCVTVLRAKLRLVPEPGARAVLLIGFSDVARAGDAVPAIVKLSEPIAIEGMDSLLVEYMERKSMHTDNLHLLSKGEAWLLVEFGGEDREDATRQARELKERLERENDPPSMRLFADPEEQEALWAVRESGLGATARVPGMHDNWPGWEDSAVAPEKVGDYLRDLRTLMGLYGLEASLYGHFGHGCVHVRMPFELRTEEGIRNYREFATQATALVAAYGGSPSGEHGDGQSRGELLSIAFGDEAVEAFREFKRVWDPKNRMNPGKVVDANPLDADLALGVDYNPQEPKTHFQFHTDDHSFSRATLRCVGVGLCRREEGGTMCPSWRVTHEEKHTTRGRAHLLHEMLRGEVVTDGWKSEEVKEALDLCLACKGCLGDCPVDVDIANYKAEFNAHYYEGRLRPPSAYAMGLIHWWARAASLMPQAANFVARSRILGPLAKRVAGLAQERELPTFAPETFRAWYRRRGGPRILGGPRVILWPDTFNNHFHPDVAKAAVRVLEAAGCEVAVPQKLLCCGRPLYDFGMMDQAKRQLVDIVDWLRDDIRAGTPVIGLEPSCTSTFRHELADLFPHDEDARRLSKQTVTLAEYLTSRGDIEWPQVDEKVAAHMHCHHKAVMGTSKDAEVLAALGVECEMLDTGCCGLAGSFGFEAEKYRVSMDVGEDDLFPKLRERPDAIVMTDGFSCKTQIQHGLDRESRHLAQVVLDALEKSGKAEPRALLRPEPVTASGSGHPAAPPRSRAP